MNEQAMKKLTNVLSEQEAAAVQSFLLSVPIEVYARVQKTEHEREAALSKYEYVGEGETFPAGCIYVPAADEEHAREALQTAGFQEILCGEDESGSENGSGAGLEIERIEQDFYKKRKLHAIEWAVIVIAMIAYALIRGRVQG